MIKHAALGSRWAEILDLNLRPVTAHLRPTSAPIHPGQSGRLQEIPLGRQPPPALRGVERRNLAAREQLLLRIRAEFEEMSGLTVTLAEAIKLFGLTPESAPRIFQELLAARVLRLTRDFRYALRVDR